MKGFVELTLYSCLYSRSKIQRLIIPWRLNRTYQEKDEIRNGPIESAELRQGIIIPTKSRDSYILRLFSTVRNSPDTKLSTREISTL